MNVQRVSSGVRLGIISQPNDLCVTPSNNLAKERSSSICGLVAFGGVRDVKQQNVRYARVANRL